MVRCIKLAASSAYINFVHLTMPWTFFCHAIFSLFKVFLHHSFTRCIYTVLPRMETLVTYVSELELNGVYLKEAHGSKLNVREELSGDTRTYCERNTEVSQCGQ